MNKPVNFEIAKLLKEKGFDEDCYRTYSNGKISPFPLLENMGGEPILNPLDYKWKNSLIHESVISAPTIAEVVMWLYEKNRIWIYVDTHEFGKWCYNFKKIEPTKEHPKINVNGKFGIEDYKSPTEAYEAAIKYCLTELIK